MPSDATMMPSDAHPAPHRRRAGLLALTFGAVGGPLAWGVRLVVNYALAADACFPGASPRAAAPGGLWPLLLAVDAIAMAIAVLAAIVSFVSWRSTRREFSGNSSEVLEIGEGRTRFLALWGIMTGCGFFIAIVFDLVNLWGLRPCG